MDMDKLLRWRDLAQKMHGRDFWSAVFDSPQTKDFMSGFLKTFDAESNYPRADVYQKETEIVVLIEIPGIRKEDVQLTVTGDRLQIKGTVHPPYPKHTNVTTERFYGPFERTIQLPEIVQKEGVSAKFVNGLLEVRLPRDLKATATSINIE